MAQETKDKNREVAKDGMDEASDDVLASPAVTTTEDALEQAEFSDSTEADRQQNEDAMPPQAAAQLGPDRYVLAAFFAFGMLAAYVLGRALHAVWAAAANKDWFNQTLPSIAAISDDEKSTYAAIVGGIVALIVVYRTYKRSDVREWSDEVAAELAKVVWPSRKDVTSSTFIVIVASTVATIYLTLLDRLWAFVTNIVYGDGS